MTGFANSKLVTEKECIEIQEKLSERMIQHNNFDVNNIRFIAGVDLAYWMVEETEYAVCSIVVIDQNSMEVIEKINHKGKITFPYIPGCLSFRELPLIIETVDQVKTAVDLFVFDGNGYLHPRHMGIATHASIILNKPSIGVAKSYYKIKETDFTMPGNQRGDFTDIIIENEVYGRVLRTMEHVKPIFISVGNNIDLDTSTTIINKLVTKESHIPMPTRLADIETRKMRTYFLNNQDV